MKRDYNNHLKVCFGFVQLRGFVMFVRANQDTQTAHRYLFLHTEELKLIAVLPALQRQWITGHLHHCVLP